jgi:hypothetical protein
MEERKLRESIASKDVAHAAANQLEEDGSNYLVWAELARDIWVNDETEGHIDGSSTRPQAAGTERDDRDKAEAWTLRYLGRIVHFSLVTTILSCTAA